MSTAFFVLLGDLVIALPSAGSLTPSLTLGVYGDREFSCKQLCQAQRAFYAVLLEMSEGTECMCTNTTYNESTGAEPTAQPDQNITMYNLGTNMIAVGILQCFDTCNCLFLLISRKEV